MSSIVEKTNLRLQKALAIRGMKQIELSEKTGITKGTISQYISGKRNPKRNAIVLMAEALSIDPVWLMGLDVPMEKEEKTKMEELAEAIKGLTERQAVLLLAFIKTMEGGKDEG